MTHPERIELISSLLKEASIRNQIELQALLEQKGIETTQSSISRDLKKLGVTKVNGFYKPLEIGPGESQSIDTLDAEAAGDNLLVLKTGPGNADRVAFVIDSAKIPGVLGSIAGDDTIFLAVRSRNDHRRILKKIFHLFLQKG